MRRAHTLGPTLALLALFAAGCESGTGTPGGLGGNAQLKVVHAAQGIGAVDVRIGSSTVITGLAYGNSSPRTNVPAGDHVLTFASGNTTIAQLTVSLTENELNAVTLNTDTAQMTPVVPDTGQPAANRANIRIINVAGSSTAPPTLLQALVNFPGVPVDSVAKFGIDATVPRHGSLMYFDPGHFRFRFVPTGTLDVLTEVEFDVAAGQKKAVVLERLESGVYVAKVVTEQ